MMKQAVWAMKAATALVKQDIRTIPVDTLIERYQLADSSFVEVQGLNVHIRDVASDDPNAPVLLCLHGIFSSLHTWEKWTELLKDQFRVISIDSPNFGLTGPFQDRTLTHDSYPNFIRDLLDTLNIEQCYLAGNSLGGFMSFNFAQRFPERVKKMILLDSAGYIFLPPWPFLAWGLPMGGWIAENSNPPRSLVYQMLRDAYADPTRAEQEELARYFDLLLRPGNRAGAGSVVRFVRNHLGFDTSDLKTLQTSTLVMWGKQDHWIPSRHAAKFKQAIPNCEVVYYDDCGHMPMEEQPEKSAEDAARFFLS